MRKITDIGHSARIPGGRNWFQRAISPRSREDSKAVKWLLQQETGCLCSRQHLMTPPVSLLLLSLSFPLSAHSHAIKSTSLSNPPVFMQWLAFLGVVLPGVSSREERLLLQHSTQASDLESIHFFKFLIWSVIMSSLTDAAIADAHHFREEIWKWWNATFLFPPGRPLHAQLLWEQSCRST